MNFKKLLSHILTPPHTSVTAMASTEVITQLYDIEQAYLKEWIELKEATQPTVYAVTPEVGECR